LVSLQYLAALCHTMWVNVGVADVQWWQLTKQETQLSLTNRETRLEILTFEKYRDCDLETGVWGH